MAAAWLDDSAVREASGVHRWDGVDWLVREPWEALVDLWALLVASTAVERHHEEAEAALRLAAALRAVAAESSYRLDRVAALAFGTPRLP
jgi:hypothetical protein